MATLFCLVTVFQGFWMDGDFKDLIAHGILTEVLASMGVFDMMAFRRNCLPTDHKVTSVIQFLLRYVMIKKQGRLRMVRKLCNRLIAYCPHV